MSTRSTTVREPTATASARFEARARAARWRARRSRLVLLGALVVVGVLAALAWWGPLLQVRTVEVLGVTGPQAEQVSALASGTTGTPLPRVDAAGLTRRVDGLAFVRTSHVQRAWPWTLRVVVAPRVAVAAVPSGRGYRLMDTEGVTFRTVPAAPRGVPVVRVPVGAEGRDSLAAVLAVLDALPASLRAQLGQVSADTPDDVQMRMGRSLVVWGSADDLELKTRVLLDLRAQHASVYDVSSPHTPVLR